MEEVTHAEEAYSNKTQKSAQSLLRLNGGPVNTTTSITCGHEMRSSMATPQYSRDTSGKWTKFIH
jgi:hypothetical protein